MFKISKDPKFRRDVSIQWEIGGPVLIMQVVFRRLPIDKYLIMLEEYSASAASKVGDHVRKKIDHLRSVIVEVTGTDEAGVTSDQVIDFLLSDLAMINGMYEEYLATMRGSDAKNSETLPAA